MIHNLPVNEQTPAWMAEVKRVPPPYEQEMREILSRFGDDFKHGWIAGGAITSTFTNSKISDFDLYFRSRADFEAALDIAYSKGYWCVSVTSRAITFKKKDELYQLMHFAYFESPNAIFGSFDFTCCMGALDLQAKQFTLHERFLADTSRRELVFNHGTRFPLASGLRVLKYQGKGYSIDRKQWIKCLAAVMFKHVDSWEAFQEQIGGAYGEVVALATDGDTPFTLENAIAALDGSRVNGKTEQEIPSNADDAKESLPGSRVEALERIAVLSACNGEIIE